MSAITVIRTGVVYLTCDICNTESLHFDFDNRTSARQPQFEAVKELAANAYSHGWKLAVNQPDRGRDYCPTCHTAIKEGATDGQSK